GKLTQRFPADALYDHRQKKKTRIAVKPIASRFEVQGLLSRDDRQRIVIRRHAVGVHAGKVKQSQVIPQSTGVVQQMQSRNRVAVIGNFREIFANVVLKGGLAVFFEQENDGRGG